MQFTHRNESLVQRGRLIWLCVPLALSGLDAGLASPPLEPVPIPAYSFDLGSPATSNGMVGADAVLEADEFPTAVVDGACLGLGRPGDDLNGLSVSHVEFPPGDQFVLLFSIDRNSVGLVDPAPALVDVGVPYNAKDQAGRGQAAGDLFMSTTLFFADAGKVLNPPGRFNSNGVNNNLVVNNFDEGGRDFRALPPTSARGYNASSRAPNEDNVDATAYISTNGSTTPGSKRRQNGDVPPLYYTVGLGSPSLGFLPGESPADIFIDHDPSSIGGQSLYAPASALGLDGNDDIDALIVFDFNTNAVFDLGDVVFFSLAPGSPSLGTELPGESPADVFRVIPGSLVELLASAEDLGLELTDDVDALELALCNDVEVCAANWGIRMWCDHDHDGDVDLHDYAEFLNCMSGPWQQSGFTMPDEWCRAAFDAEPDGTPDGDVDLADFTAFQIDFTGERFQTK